MNEKPCVAATLLVLASLVSGCSSGDSEPAPGPETPGNPPPPATFGGPPDVEELLGDRAAEVTRVGCTESIVAGSGLRPDRCDVHLEDGSTLTFVRTDDGWVEQDIAPGSRPGQESGLSGSG